MSRCDQCPDQNCCETWLHEVCDHTVGPDYVPNECFERPPMSYPKISRQEYCSQQSDCTIEWCIMKSGSKAPDLFIEWEDYKGYIQCRDFRPRQKPEAEYLEDAVSDKYTLEVAECACGFHFGIDSTFLEQESNFIFKCSACDREHHTAEVFPE